VVRVIVILVHHHGCSARMYGRPRGRREDNIKVDLKKINSKIGFGVCVV
jgi:hypothetical protein